MFLFVAHLLHLDIPLCLLSLQYGDIDINGESDTDEPSQQTVDKYLCSRRHTVGPGDTHHEEVGSPLDTALFYITLVCIYRFSHSSDKLVNKHNCHTRKDNFIGVENKLLLTTTC